ncbi:MAG: glycoside hydrolase family 104 protein [Acinetobacter sp.]
MSERQQLEKLLNDPNARKMLDLIANAEGVKHGYNTGFGNDRIASLSAHPNVRKEFTQTDGKKNVTTAAGRYQFLKPTWDGLAKQYGLKDFSPRNQDLAALALIAKNGAMKNVMSGDYQGAVKKLGGTWASLPSSTYAQPKKTYAQLGLSGGGMQKGSMNDLHSLFQGGAKDQKVNSTGRQLRQGFASDIPPELRNTAPAQQAKKVTSNSDNFASMNDLHSLFVAQKRANYQPFDNTKAARNAREQEALKGQDKTQFWESGLLGMADIGVPFVQGAQWAKDQVSKGVNAVAGTNLPTNTYEGVTKTYKNINDAHNTVRKANNQGIDVGRVGANMLMTAPLAAAGGTLQAGTALASKAGAQFLGKNAAIGGLIGATGVHENNTQRLQSMAAGALGGAIGAGVGQKVGEGAVKMARKLTPARTAQRLSQQVDDQISIVLKQNNIKISDLSDDVVAGLRADVANAMKAGKAINKEAVARKLVFDRLGIKPTQAQMTGDPKLWQKQAELAKIQGAGDPLRDQLLLSENKIISLLDDSIASTGGKATDQYGAAKGAADSLLGQNQQNKDFVGAAYDYAMKADGNNVVLDGRGFANDAFTRLEQQYAASSLPTGVKKIIDDVSKHPDQFTLGKSEELIKVLNREYSSSLQNGQPTSSTYAIGLVRDALKGRQDEAMQGLVASGSDAAQAYQFARKAHGLSKQQIEKMPLLQDVLKGAEPDKLFSKHILNGNVDQLDETLKTLSNVSPQAVADIKQQTLQWVSKKAVNQNGGFSPAGMKRALDSLGDRRLATMFSADELKRIKDIGMAGHYLVTQPNHSYVNNSNTSAALMNFLGGIINKPGVRVLLSPLKDVADSVQVNRALKTSIASDRSPQAIQQTLSGGEKSLINRLTQMGLIGGANLPDPQ